MSKTSCKECGGAMVQVDIQPVAGGERLRVTARRMFTLGTLILAYGCTSCGKLEFYAEKPGKLS